MMLDLKIVLKSLLAIVTINGLGFIIYSKNQIIVLIFKVN